MRLFGKLFLSLFLGTVFTFIVAFVLSGLAGMIASVVGNSLLSQDDPYRAMSPVIFYNLVAFSVFCTSCAASFWGALLMVARAMDS